MPGTYTYQFIANDKWQEVAFPVSPKSGPTIGTTTPGALALTAAAAEP